MKAVIRTVGAAATTLGLLGSLVIATSVASAATELPPPGIGTTVVPYCAVSNLGAALISANDTAGAAASATFGVTNRGDTFCRVAGNVSVQLLDADGQPYAVRMAVRTMMAMLIALRPGQTASFTIGYTGSAAGCAESAHVAVIVPGSTRPARIVVPARIAACTGIGAPQLRVSNLTLAVPVPTAAPPSASPLSPAPSPTSPAR